MNRRDLITGAAGAALVPLAVNDTKNYREAYRQLIDSILWEPKTTGFIRTESVTPIMSFDDELAGNEERIVMRPDPRNGFGLASIKAEGAPRRGVFDL